MSNTLTSLKYARWETAFRTFGNNHSTLVGLLVDWWISVDPGSRWALEGGPSFGHNTKGVGGGMCDAILGEGMNSRGLIEVEGTRYDYTIDKIGKFFSSGYEEMKTLDFAIFLAYAYQPIGRGVARHIPNLPMDAFIQRAQMITNNHPGKQIVLLGLDKSYERIKSGPRRRNEYYWGRSEVIRGVLVDHGQVVQDDFCIHAADVLSGQVVHPSPVGVAR